MTTAGGQSEADGATGHLNEVAATWQRRFRWTLALSLSLGVAAGFVALVPTRGGRLAAVFLMVVATGAVWIIGSLRMEARWHETRDRVERLHSVKFRYRMAIAPYADEPSLLRVSQDLAALGVMSGPDPSWEVTRSLAIEEQVAWYRSHRLADQRGFYQLRATAFRQREIYARRAILCCYIAVSFIAVAQFLDAWTIELVAPFAAVLAALQAWSATRRWGHTAQIYESAIVTIDAADLQLTRHLLTEPVDCGAIKAVVEVAESTLDRESARWLALHNFTLADEKYLKGGT